MTVRMAVAVVLEFVPLIIMLMGGTLLSADRRRELLYNVAVRIDRANRGLHDRIAEELDRLSVADR